MQKYKKCKLNSFVAIQTVINKEQTTFDLLPDFAAKYSAFCAAVENIRAASPQQQYANVAEQKALNIAKNSLVEQISLVSKKLVIHADDTANSALKADVEYSTYQLSRLKTGDLIDVSRMVAERATKVLPLATLAKLSQADIDPIAALIDSAQIRQAAFRNWQIKHKQDTRVLNAAFDNADAALSKMSLSISLFEHSNPMLLTRFMDAKRVIVPFRKLSLKGAVAEAKTEYPLSGVTISIRKLSDAAPSDLMITKPEVKKVSAIKGGFNIKNLTEGEYLATASKMGYKTNHIQFTVSPTETTNLNLLLEVA